MRLRQLEIKDAVPMLAWMHDISVVSKMQTDFLSKTLEDCISFIKNSQDAENIHLAVTDDNDEYMGTVSLKHITKSTAEFAITVCKEAMGKGYSAWAMKEIIKIGFERYSLEHIYWCVASDNVRAIKFYDKNGYPRVQAENIDIACSYSDEQIASYMWYQVDSDDYESA